MNKNDIKHVIGKLVTDKETEYRLSEKIVEKQHNKVGFKRIASIAASFAMIICFGIAGYVFWEQKPDPSPQSITSPDGIYLPKIELPKKTNVAMNMIGLIVYQGKIYTQTGTKVNPESAEKLLGEKLGTTKGNIDEWSRQDDYAVEFASSIGKQDVYSVKGYDKNFRIMTYEKTNGVIYAEFYECFNGITVKSGADVFAKLKIENRITAVKYENFDSWNHTKQQYKELPQIQIVNSFVNELKNTIPYDQKDLSYLWNDKDETKQKFVYLVLNDGSEVQLRLFKEGYIYYNCSHIFFRMENQVFTNLWNILE